MHVSSTTKSFTVKSLAIVILLFPALLFAQLDRNQKTLYGLLHAHSMICDGVGTPEQAFITARDSGLHFFAMTPHNHSAAEQGAKDRRDDVLIANQPDLYSGTQNVTVTRRWKEGNNTLTETLSVKPLIKAAREISNQKFVALYGQEFSTISKGNHVNVLGIDKLLDVEDGNFRAMLSELEKASAAGFAPVVQLNHPDVQEDLFYNGSNSSTRSKMFNDYGIDEGDLGPHFSSMINALDPYTHLIEVLSGPAMATERRPDFRYNPNENDYFFYLKQGFHISPSVGQDNHYATWGFVTDARMGVVANELSEQALYNAFRKQRTFASEDKNLKTIFYLNDSLMGASVRAATESELKIKVLLEDADEPNANYTIELYGGEINPELSTTATNWKLRDGLIERKNSSGNSIVNFSLLLATNQPVFYFAKVIQDGKDRAWTAPVWVNDKRATTVVISPPLPRFAWSKSSSSKVYHLRGCSTIYTIKEENLVTGDTPPTGRTPHACNVVDEEEGH